MPSTAGAASNAAAGGDDPASEPQQQQPGVSTAAATNGGLVSPNGSSILWDADSMWILMFDNLLREGTRSPTKRSCGCKGDPRGLTGSVAVVRAESRSLLRPRHCYEARMFLSGEAVLFRGWGCPGNGVFPPALERSRALSGSPIQLPFRGRA